MNERDWELNTFVWDVEFPAFTWQTIYDKEMLFMYSQDEVQHAFLLSYYNNTAVDAVDVKHRMKDMLNTYWDKYAQD